MRRFLKRHALALALAFLYLYSFPYFPAIHSANELPRVYLTQAIARDGVLYIDEGVRRWGATADVSPAGEHQYSNKAPGSSMLAVPAYLALAAVKSASGAGEPTLAEMMWTFRVATGVVPTLAFLLLFWRFLGRFAAPEPRRVALVGYALGSMAMTYSVLFIAHQLAAVCIATAYILAVRLVRDGGDARLGWLVGLAAGAAPLMDYQAAFAGVPVAVYLVVHLLVREPARWRAVAFAVAGSAVPIAVLLLYHWSAFGSPLATGYAASTTFAHYHQRGFLGADALRWEAFIGSTVAPDNGLLFLCPMLLLVIPGWWILWQRREHWQLGITVAVVATYLVFISSLIFWRGGWQLGPRYITAMLPFAMVPVAAALDRCSDDSDRHWLLRGSAVGLVLVGVVVYALSSAQYPHFPEVFRNPLYEVTFRLLREDYAPYNLGYVFGLRGFASLLPYLLVLAAVMLWVALPSRRRWRSALVALLLASGIVAAYGGIAGGGAAAEAAYARWVAGVMP